MRARLLATEPGATAAWVIGPGAAVSACVAEGGSGVAPVWGGFTVIWATDPAGDRVALTMLPGEGQPVADAADALARGRQTARLRSPAVDGATPPVATATLAEALGNGRLERDEPAGQPPVAVARSGAVQSATKVFTAVSGCAFADRS